MAERKFKANINLTQNELVNAVVEQLAADPGGAVEGQFYWNTVSKVFRIHNGTAFEDVGGLTDPFLLKGSIDASANPNYPAADAGDLYKISVAGKIGGVSGPVVEIGDTIYCITDSTATGDHATVGSNWVILQTNLDQATEGVAGFAELATQVETDTGTDDLRIVTPLKLKTNIATYRYNQTFGDGTLKTFAINHALGTEMVFIAVFDDTTKEEVETEIVHTDANNVQITVQGAAPTLNQYRVAVIS